MNYWIIVGLLCGIIFIAGCSNTPSTEGQACSASAIVLENNSNNNTAGSCAILNNSNNITRSSNISHSFNFSGNYTPKNDLKINNDSWLGKFSNYSLVLS